MKPIIKLAIAFCIIIFSIHGLSAQDVIHKTSGEVLHTKVIEVGANQLKYQLFEDQNQLIYTTDNRDLVKIVFESGMVKNYTNSLKDPKLYQHQKNQAIKFDLLGPLRGLMEFSYEKITKPGKGYFLKLGIIGIGKDLFEQNARGAYASASFKLVRFPRYTSPGSRQTHILNGAYVRPEIVFGVYSADDTSYRSDNSSERSTVRYGGALINVGHQWILGNAVLLDIYYGVGYGIVSGYDDNGVNYGISTISDDRFSLALSGGISLGIPFGGQQKEK